MFNYRNPPPSPTSDEIYRQGDQIGSVDIDILDDSNNPKIFTYWGGFKKSNFERFTNHPTLDILKKIYSSLNSDQVIMKFSPCEFFLECKDSDFTPTKMPKKKYPKGTKFTAWLRLRIILRPWDYEKGKLVFEYDEYAFPDGIPKMRMNQNLYDLFIKLYLAIKSTR